MSLSQTSVEHIARHFTTNLQSHRYRMKRAEVLKVKIRAWECRRKSVRTHAQTWSLISFTPTFKKSFRACSRFCVTAFFYLMAQNNNPFISTFISPPPLLFSLLLLTSCNRWMCSLQVSKSLSPGTTISPRGMAGDTEEQDNYPTAL